MGNYKNSDYARNKNSLDIVYDGTTGIEIVTIDDFLKENPNLTLEDYIEIKIISDSIYEEIDRSDVRYSKRKISLDELNYRVLFNLYYANVDICMNSYILSKVQKRRFKLFFLEEINCKEIAELENVSPQAISKSIKLIVKTLKKSLNFD